MSNERIFLACRSCKANPALLAKEWGGWIGDTCEAWPSAAAALEQFFKRDHAACSVSGFYLSDELGREITAVVFDEDHGAPDWLLEAQARRRLTPPGAVDLEARRAKRLLTNALADDV